MDTRELSSPAEQPVSAASSRTDTEKKATHQEIKGYVLEHSGLKVSSLYIAQVKQQCEIIERENCNRIGFLRKYSVCTENDQGG